jgi:hypothetical protein
MSSIPASVEGHAREEAGPRQTIRQLGVSFLLVFVLGLQTLASFSYFGGKGWRWPFIDYPMYSQPYYKGDAVPVYALKAVCEDGTRRRIDASDLRFNLWEYWEGPVKAAKLGNVPALRRFLEPFIAQCGLDVKSVELWRTPYEVGDKGIQRNADEIMNAFEWRAAP